MALNQKSFGELIRDHRRELGLSQRDLAKQIGIIDYITLSKIENDRYFDGNFDPMLVTAIAFALQLDEDVAFDAAQYSANNPSRVSLEEACFLYIAGK